MKSTHTTSSMKCSNSGNVLDFVGSLKKILFQTEVPWKYDRIKLIILFKNAQIMMAYTLTFVFFCFQRVKKLTDFQHSLLFRKGKKIILLHMRKKKQQSDVICGIALIFDTTRTVASLRITKVSHQMISSELDGIQQMFRLT